MSFIRRLPIVINETVFLPLFCLEQGAPFSHFITTGIDFTMYFRRYVTAVDAAFPG